MNQTLNKVTLIGFLGCKFKIHYFEPTKCVARGDLATHEIYFNTSNEKITRTQWHQLVLHNDWAVWAEKHLQKGDKLYVEGRIYTKYWQNKQGQQMQSTEIIVQRIIPLERVEQNKNVEQNIRNQEIENFEIPKNNEEEYPF